MSFIDNLAQQALPKAKEESHQVNEFGQKLLGRKVEFYDRAYVIEKMKEQLYSVNHEEIRKYFPVKKVLAGLFEIVQNLYDISFVENKDVSIWHEDVVAFTVLNNRKENIGLLYLDLYKRKNKESGA